MFTIQTNEHFKEFPKHEEPNIPEDELACKYQLGKCIEWIIQNKFERTCLQFPEELLNDGTSVAIYLQKVLGKVVYLLGDTLYGSCCVDEVAAEHIKADSIIHFGHACLSPVINLPVFYSFLKEDLNLSHLQSTLESFPENKYLIIFYDDVYHHLYPSLISIFKHRQNIHVSILNTKHENIDKTSGKRMLCGRVFDSVSASNVSAVYIGEEESSALDNLLLSLPDFTWYFYSSKEELLKECNRKRNKFLMKRMALVEKVKEASTIGILIGTLGIKNYLDAIERIKVLVRKNGKKCYKLAVGKPNVAKLANFPEIDVFVCISCQENPLTKDFTGYYKPIVSLLEVEFALGGRPYGQEYTSDFRELLPGGSFYKEPDCKTDSTDSMESSQELMERNAGTLVESSGARFLLNRTWQGLEQRIGETGVFKAIKGRSGIPQSYDNELETLSGEKP